MYRTVALAFARTGSDAAKASELPEPFELVVRHDGAGAMRVVLNGEDVSEAIRTGEMGSMASRVSALPWVRDEMVRLQRELAATWEAEGGGVVLDGRDIGTVVFPDAQVKIFMVADVRERAQRRLRELAASGETNTLDAVEAALRQRDVQDETRAIAPLRPAPDAVLLDTTRLSPEEQVDFVVKRVQERA